MKIIIAGAGDVGFHLAELLSYENQEIILIDNNQDVLDYAATHLDVLTITGDSTSIAVLKDAQVASAKLFIAVTTSESTNLITTILAKKMGAKQTIARVRNDEYLTSEHRETFNQLGVDSVISPRQLASKEIQRLIKKCSFTDIFDFEDGKISLAGMTLNNSSPLLNMRLMDFPEMKTDLSLRPIAILRGHRTIIPRGNHVLRHNDHIYFITNKSNIDRIEQFVGGNKPQKSVKKIMIIGGTGLAYETARLLENDYRVTLLEKNKERCKLLAANLHNTLVIHGKANDFDLMMEEGLEEMDAFIGLTDNSETNIIACLTAKNHGVYKTIAQVENKEYTHISQNIGVDTLINMKLIAANNIFRYVRKGRVEAITSLHGVDAEVIEFVITKNNQLTKKALKDLHFPETALIGGVIRGEDSLIPGGNFQLQLGDKVIVFTLPEGIAKVEKLFR
ncbi:MAG: trk system potassium uptake protein TrkA [Paraglaciecola sp.]|jgi:trk system potassium uptake protein TrkA